MGNYYDSDYETRGIDYDLHACLRENPQDAFTVDDIDKVLAVHTGEHEGEDWVWLLRLKTGRHVMLWGGCDYTGWDCQSSADYLIADDLTVVVDGFVAQNEDKSAIADEFAQQLSEGKTQTWRERMDVTLGLKGG